MKRLSVLPAFLLTLAAGTVSAQLPEYQGAYTPGQSLQEYFAESEQNENKSIIYVFLTMTPAKPAPKPSTSSKKFITATTRRNTACS